MYQSKLKYSLISLKKPRLALEKFFFEVIILTFLEAAEEIKTAIASDIRESIGKQNVFDAIAMVVLKQPSTQLRAS